MRSTALVLALSGFATTVVWGALPRRTVGADTPKASFGGVEPTRSRTLALSNRYFVIMDHTLSNNDGLPILSVAQRVTDVFDRVLSIVPGARLAQQFHSELFQGMSVEVGEGTSAEHLLAIKGVKSVYPVGIIPHPISNLPDPRPHQSRRSIGSKDSSPRVLHRPARRGGNATNPYHNETFAPHAMTGVDGMHAQGLYGKGARVCVIDSGADYRNTMLGGCFGPGCKVVVGFDFVGDDGNSPGPDPYSDCDNHATHILGTIGANANDFGFVGVAPDAELGLYRIFPCSKVGAPDDLLVQALLRAEKDGCQVISASFSNGDSPWPDDYPPQMVIKRLSERGIVFVAASGNSAASGLFSGQNPAIVKSALSVGSVDVDAFPRVFPLSFDNSSREPVRYLSTSPSLANESMRVHFVSTSQELDLDNCACSPLPSNTPDLKDRVVVVQLVGKCDLVTQQVNLAQFNARYIVLHDISESDQAVSTFYMSAVDRGTYLLGMPKADGIRLLSYYMSNQNGTIVNFRTRDPLLAVPNIATGGLISSFASLGPSNTLASPGTNVVAPGGVILSTFPRSMGSIGILSGTSMATPLVAGAAALLLSSRKEENLSSDQIRSLLATTTEPVAVRVNSTSPLSSVLVQGNGLISVKRAYEAKTLISPYFLALNDSSVRSTNYTITVTNKNARAVTYTFGSVGAETLTLFNESASAEAIIPATPPVISSLARISFNPTRLTVPAGKSASFSAKVVAPTRDSDRYPFYSGAIVITGDDVAKQRFYVSYFGLAARLIDAPVLYQGLTHESEYGVAGLRYPFVSIGSPGYNVSVLTNSGVSEASTPSIKRSQGITLVYRLTMPTHQLLVDLVHANTTFRATIGPSPPSSNLRPRSVDFTRHDRMVSRSVQFFNSTQIIGHVSSRQYLDRDHLGNYDQQCGFNGKVYTSPNNTGAATAVALKTPYRLLLRALKLTADPNLEDSYASYLSAPFQFED